MPTLLRVIAAAALACLCNFAAVAADRPAPPRGMVEIPIVPPKDSAMVSVERSFLEALTDDNWQDICSPAFHREIDQAPQNHKFRLIKDCVDTYFAGSAQARQAYAVSGDHFCIDAVYAQTRLLRHAGFAAEKIVMLVKDIATGRHKGQSHAFVAIQNDLGEWNFGDNLYRRLITIGATDADKWSYAVTSNGMFVYRPQGQQTINDILRAYDKKKG